MGQQHTSDVAALSTPSKRWVWHCSEESIANGAISLLAIAEIPIATAFFWWVSSVSPLPWLTLVGFLATPILLLRSEASIRYGINLLDDYMIPPAFQHGLLPIKFIVTLVLCAIATPFFVHWLAERSLSGTFSWSLYWRLAMLEFISVAIAFVIGGTAHIALWPEVDRPWFLIAIIGVIVGSVAILTEVPVTMPVVVVMAIAAISSLYFIIAFRLAISHLTSGYVTDPRHIRRIWDLVTVLTLPPIALGVLMRATFIRLWASARYLSEGLAQLPQNWRETVAVIDVFHLPELLPGSSSVFRALSIKGLLESRHEDQSARIWFPLLPWGPYGIITVSLLSLSMYIPATLYRWNLKASAWIWWPLAIVLRRPFFGQSEQDKRYDSSVSTKGYWASKREWFVWVAALWLLTPALSSQVSNTLSTIKSIEPGLRLASLLAPPPVLGIRYWLIWLCVALTFWLSKRSMDYRAAYGKPAEGAKDWDDHKIEPENMSHLIQKVEAIERLRQCCTATYILTIWIFGFWWVQSRWPELFGHAIWSWFKPWL